MKMEIYLRANDHIPLMPLSVESVGNKKYRSGEVDFTAAAKNQFIEVVWCVDGLGEIDYYGSKISMTKNSVFYWLQDEDHLLRALNNQFEVHWLCIQGPYAETIFRSYRYPRFLLPARECPVELFQQIGEQISQDDVFVQRCLVATVMTILAHMAPAEKEERKSFVLTQVYDYIQNNFSNPNLTVEMLADHFEVPLSTLTRLFSKVYTNTLARTIHGLRYKKACMLLRSTDLPVNKIASRCGYKIPISFSRMFRHLSGMSPSEFRNKQ